jgi:hypothetical protein
LLLTPCLPQSEAGSKSWQRSSERVSFERACPSDLEAWDGGQVTLARTPDVRIREQRGRSVTWRLESAPAPRAATPPDVVTRFPVMRWRMEIDYGAAAPAAAGVTVAADASASREP